MDKLLSTMSKKMSSKNLEKIHTENDEEGNCLIEKPPSIFPIEYHDYKDEVFNTTEILPMAIYEGKKYRIMYGWEYLGSKTHYYYMGLNGKKVHVSCVSRRNKKPNKFAKFKGLVFKHLETFDCLGVADENKINTLKIPGKDNYNGGRYD